VATGWFPNAAIVTAPNASQPAEVTETADIAEGRLVTGLMHLSQNEEGVNPALLVEETVTVAVQVNGKLRGSLELALDCEKKEAETAALGLPNVEKAMDGHEPRKIIIVPNRIINVVI